MNQEQFETRMLEKLDGIEQRLSHLEQEADLVRGRLERRGGHRMAEVRRTSTPENFSESAGEETYAIRRGGDFT